MLTTNGGTNLEQIGQRYDCSNNRVFWSHMIAFILADGTFMCIEGLCALSFAQFSSGTHPAPAIPIFLTQARFSSLIFISRHIFFTVPKKHFHGLQGHAHKWASDLASDFWSEHNLKWTEWISFNGQSLSILFGMTFTCFKRLGFVWKVWNGPSGTPPAIPQFRLSDKAPGTA